MLKQLVSSIAGMARFAAIIPLMMIVGVAACGDEVRLRAGDIVQLKLLGVPQKDTSSVSGLYTVAGEGTLRIPYVEEEISAAGLRPSELAREIEKRYVASKVYTRPIVLIAVDLKEAIRFITVAGEVRSPGDVPYRHDLTLLAALSSRGGFTDFANAKKVRLIRGGKVTMHNLKQISVTPQADISLQPGDRLIVPKAGLFGGK